MSQSRKDLRELALYHLNTGIVCFGLSFLGGPACPVNPDKLTISDLQVGHLVQNDLFGDKLYKEILSLKKPLDQYVPLCVLCNWRMRDLKEECHKYGKDLRIEAVQYALKHSGNAAGRKFGTNGTTIRGWAKDQGVCLRTRRSFSEKDKKEIVDFAAVNSVTKAAKKFSVGTNLIYAWRKA